MIFKGYVISIEKNYAVVITTDMEYFKVIRRDNLNKGKEIIFLQDDIYIEKNKLANNLIKCAAIFLTLLLSVSMVLNSNIFNHEKATAAILSIDINPSLEIEINKDYKVVKLIPINEEASKISDSQFLGMNISDVTIEILKDAKYSGYIEENSKIILISVAIIEENSVDINEIIAKIEKYIAKDSELKGIKIYQLHVDIASITTARSKKLSLGRYELYRELTKSNTTINLDDVRKEKIDKLIDMREYQYRIMNTQKIRNNCNNINDSDSMREEIRRFEEYRKNYRNTFDNQHQEYEDNSKENPIKHQYRINNSIVNEQNTNTENQNSEESYTDENNNEQETECNNGSGKSNEKEEENKGSDAEIDKGNNPHDDNPHEDNRPIEPPQGPNHNSKEK